MEWLFVLVSAVRGKESSINSTGICGISHQFARFIQNSGVHLQPCIGPDRKQLPLGILGENIMESKPQYCTTLTDARTNHLALLNFVRSETFLPSLREVQGEKGLTDAVSRTLSVNPTIHDYSRYPTELENAITNSVCFDVEKPLEQLIINNATSQPITGHRRWLFHPLLKGVSVGHHGNVTCIRMIDISEGVGSQGQFVVFPTPGHYPLSLSRGDWTFSYIGDLSNADVHMVGQNGELIDLDINREFVTSGMMSLPTLLFHPKTNLKASTYYVYIKLRDRAFSYRVHLIDCGEGRSLVRTASMASVMFCVLFVMSAVTVKKRSDKRKLLAILSPLQEFVYKDD